MSSSRSSGKRQCVVIGRHTGAAYSRRRHRRAAVDGTRGATSLPSSHSVTQSHHAYRTACIRLTSRVPYCCLVCQSVLTTANQFFSDYFFVRHLYYKNCLTVVRVFIYRFARPAISQCECLRSRTIISPPGEKLFKYPTSARGVFHLPTSGLDRSNSSRKSDFSQQTTIAFIVSLHHGRPSTHG